MKKLVSWNVNGIRAIHRKTNYDWFREYDADIFCIQETKAHPVQLNKAQLNIEGYHSFYESAQRKGYSGVAVFTKEKPVEVINGLGIEAFDSEGRVLEVIYDDFTLFNVYFPNGRASKARLDFKMAFYEAFLNKMAALLEQGRKVIVCGDVNTAHREIDLARPKENSKHSGFLQMERDWIDDFLDVGFVDSLRTFKQDEGLYSWWDYKTKARERNTGWRIDYFYVSENMKDEMMDASILSNVMGSDHCPIELVLK